VRLEFDMTTLIMIAILALVAVQTMQIVNLSTTISALQVGGGAAASASTAASSVAQGVGAC